MRDDTIDLEVYGIDELDAKLANFNARLAREVFTESIAHGAAYMAELAKQNAPTLTEAFGSRRPGELRDSIGVIMEDTNPDKPNRIGALITPFYDGSPDSPGVWGKFVEYGSIHNPTPEPYLRPALDDGAEPSIEVFFQTASGLFDAMSGEEGTGVDE